MDTSSDERRPVAESLRQQQDLEAIARGIDDMEAGRVMTLEEMDRRMNEEFGFPLRNK